MNRKHIPFRQVTDRRQPAPYGIRFLAAIIWLGFAFGLIAQPTITQQPTSASVSLGATVVLSVSAATTSPPLSYQWTLEGTNLPGATLATLTLENLTLDQEGTYRVVVTDNVGSSTSNPAILDVDPTFIFATRALVGDDSFLPSDNYRSFPFWADYDGDGWLEMIVCPSDQGMLPLHNAIYENNRDGTFTRITNGLALLGERWSGPSWADYDRDGDLDCLFGQWQPDPHVMFLNQLSQGTADFIPVQMGDLISGGTVTPAGLNASAVDYDNDGWVDLAFTWWRNVGGRTGTNFLLRNVGGRFEPVTNTPFALSGEAIEWQSWVDYDDDGDVDFFGATSPFPGGRKDILFQNQGAGRFLRITNHVLVNQDTANIMGGWADYDNDGDLDVFLPIHDTLPSVLYRNVGGGQFERDEQAPQLLSAAGPLSSTWGDYDNDGDLDVIVAQQFDRNRLFNNDGTGRLTEVWVGNPTGLSDRNYAGSWADYNNDGFLDLLTISYLRRDELYLNNLPQTGNQNHWLKIQLKGVVSNPNGLGAKIRVQATIGGRSVRQTRQIGIWTIFGNDLLAHFGLGDAILIDTLRIEWPSGIVQELHDVPANQALTITEEVYYPYFSAQPQDQILTNGQTATFTVAAVTDTPPLTYQWRFNEVPLPGQTNPTLVIADVQRQHEGFYDVVVSDANTSLTSRTSRLTVLIPPAVTQLVTNYTVVQGGTLTLSIQVDGTLPMSYRWMRLKSPNQLTTLQQETRQDDQSFLVLNNVQPDIAGPTNRYWVILTNTLSFTPGVVSPSIYLTVLPDTDGDLLPDPWETNHNLNPNDPTDGDQDTDSDGLTNREEYQSGTDPQDPASYLKIGPLNAGSPIHLEFPAAEGKTYTVRYKDNLTGDTWHTLADVVAGPARTVTITDADPRPERYYQLVTPRRGGQ